MERRKVLKSVAAFIPISAAFAGLAAMGVRFITPIKREIDRKIFTVGLEELPLNATKRFKDLRGRDLMLVRTGEREVKAISTVCTHLGCTVHWDAAQNMFLCACHGGKFAVDGIVKAGPPPRPLDELEFRVDSGNLLIGMA